MISAAQCLALWNREVKVVGPRVQAKVSTINRGRSRTRCPCDHIVITMIIEPTRVGPGCVGLGFWSMLLLKIK